MTATKYSQVVPLDRWKITVTTAAATAAATTTSTSTSPNIAGSATQSTVRYMGNYFGIGVAARIVSVLNQY